LVGGLHRHAVVGLLSGIPCWAGGHFVIGCIAVFHAWLAGVEYIEYWLKSGFFPW